MSNLKNFKAYQINDTSNIKGGDSTVEGCFYGTMGSGISGGIAGAGVGGALGSAAPVVGTLAGASLGGALGFLGGAMTGMAAFCLN